MSKSIVIVGAGGMPGGYNGNIYHEFSKTIANSPKKSSNQFSIYSQKRGYFDSMLCIEAHVFLFFASGSSALQLSNEPKLEFILNTAEPERFQAHNDTYLWSRG